MSRLLTRCAWCGADPSYMAYHDHEWGVPLKDSYALYELLMLEGMQAGLSWITILKRREHFREAFDQFDPHKIARYSPKKITSLLQNAQIIRHPGKIAAIVQNANAYLRIEERMSFSTYIWQFTEHQTIQNAWKEQRQVPAWTELSEKMAKTMKKDQFAFVGKTICYAFMQSAGLVNDHLVSCFRYKETSNNGGP